jgi:hypothetical protein
VGNPGRQSRGDRGGKAGAAGLLRFSVETRAGNGLSPGHIGRRLVVLRISGRPFTQRGAAPSKSTAPPPPPSKSHELPPRLRVLLFEGRPGRRAGRGKQSTRSRLHPPPLSHDRPKDALANVASGPVSRYPSRVIRKAPGSNSAASSSPSSSGLDQSRRQSLLEARAPYGDLAKRDPAVNACPCLRSG